MSKQPDDDETESYTFRIRKRTRAALAEHAKAEDRKLANFINRVLDAYVEENAKVVDLARRRK